MVGIYIDGEKIGAVSDDAYAESLSKNKCLELRDSQGHTIALFPLSTTVDADEPLVPWDATFTRKELERRRCEPSFTFEEMKKRLGWE